MASKFTISEDLASLIHSSAKILAAAGKVAAFTGAGMSAESGIGTFRGQGGLWKGIVGPVALTVFGTPVGWRLMPVVSWKAYLSHFYDPMKPALPNPGHRALATLAEAGVPVKIVTQNVDGLHQRAGSDPSGVYEVHGTVLKYKCNHNGHRYEFPVDQAADPQVMPDLPRSPPVCSVPGCGYYIRPDCVLFTENLPGGTWARAEDAMTELGPGDVLLVVGTSSTVQPAASLPVAAAAKGAHVFEFNLEETSFGSLPNHTFFQGPAGQILPALVEEALRIRGEGRS